MDAIELINRIQEELMIPDCFVLSQAKLMNEDTMCMLIQDLDRDTMNIGDKYAILEIIKQWIEMKREDENHG